MASFVKLDISTSPLRWFCPWPYRWHASAWPRIPPTMERPKVVAQKKLANLVKWKSSMRIMRNENRHVVVAYIYIYIYPVDSINFHVMTIRIWCAGGDCKVHTFVKPTGEHKHLEAAIIIQSQLNEAYSYGITWMHIGPGIFYELTSHFNGCPKKTQTLSLFEASGQP